MKDETKIKTFENFLTKEEVDLFIEYAKSKERWDNSSRLWDNRILGLSTIYKDNKKLSFLLNDVKNRIANLIKESYSLEENVYADLIQICRWFPGSSQSPHADDMTNVPTAGPGYSHRQFGAVIYLNEDYEGGHTFYPDYNIEVTPKSGMLALHPATPEYLHGVTEIKDSVRYTIASFWTNMIEFNDDTSFLYQ